MSGAATVAPAHAGAPPTGAAPVVERLEVAGYAVPNDLPAGVETDGTLGWSQTEVVVVEAHAAGHIGLGYTYGDLAAGAVVRENLVPLVEGRDALAVGAAWAGMVASVRNAGRPGIASRAIAAVDIALWDLAARLLGVPVATLAGGFRDRVPVYGSGGFTSYAPERLAEQLAGWVQAGIPAVKMKVGRRPKDDPERVRLAREAIGPDADLMADANGAYHRKQALLVAERFAEHGVSWLEEPVTSDDLAGLRMLCERAPAGMDVTAGEYGFHAPYFARMLGAEAVDCLQADATRCGGITGFLQVAGMCSGHTIDLSAHTAPSVHAHAACGAQHLRHIEWFHDHVRIEGMLFDGVLAPEGGELRIDPGRPGLGLELRRADAERWRA